jgi:hypothetical protein
MEMFIDIDSADDLFLLHLLAHGDSVGDRLKHNDGIKVSNAENVYIGQGASLFIGLVGKTPAVPCTVNLSNVVIDNGASLSIIVETDAEEVFIQKVVCTQSDITIRLRSNRMENLLVANYDGDMLAPEPWSYCGANGQWLPLFPAFTPFIRNMA